MKFILSLTFPIICALACSCVTLAQEATVDKMLSVLPRQWLGVWRGEVKSERHQRKSGYFSNGARDWRTFRPSAIEMEDDLRWKSR